LLAAAAVAGLGNSVFHPADFTLLNRNVGVERLGHAFSVHGLSGNLGWALAPVFLSGLAVAFNWRVAAFGAVGVAFLALAVLFSRRAVIAEPPLHTQPAAREAMPIFAFLRSPAVWLCFVFFFLTTMAFGIVQNFMPSVLQHLYDFSIPAGASALTAFLLGGAGGIVLGGFLASGSQAHERYIAIGLTCAAGIGLVIASTALPSWTVVPLLALMGFSSGIAGPSRDMLVRRAATARFGNRAFGRVYGFVYSGLDIGLASAPVAFGPFMDAGHFAWVVIGAAALQGLAVLTAVNVTRGVPAAVTNERAS
jgi:MFS family permease